MARQTQCINSPDALLYGAVAVSMHQMENVRPAKIDERIQSFVDTVRSRVHGPQPQALLAHLHEFLFEEQKFAGDTGNFYATINSYLPAVLETRQGLPITLSLVYKTVAERLGLRVWGVALPGHFLCAVDAGGTEPMLVDPFSGGRILTADEAYSHLREVFGPDMEWNAQLLQPTSNRHWLTRMLQNLLNIFGAGGHYADVAAMLELEMLLWPDEDRLQRDLALVLARVGLSEPAGMWLGRYLRNNPDDPQQSDLRQLLDVLKA